MLIGKMGTTSHLPCFFLFTLQSSTMDMDNPKGEIRLLQMLDYSYRSWFPGMNMIYYKLFLDVSRDSSSNKTLGFDCMADLDG